MGQYYKPTFIENDNTIKTLNTWDYDCGLKLMEHSYVSCPVVLAALTIIKNHPVRVAWVGDYSNDRYGNDVYEKKISKTRMTKYYRAAWGKNRNRYLVKPEIDGCEGMDAGMYLVNHTTKTYVDMDRYIKDNTERLSYKDWRTGETIEYDQCVAPLPLLTACGNDRGGGDYHDAHPDYDKVGSWAGDLIELSDKKPDGYEEVMYSFKED